MGRRKYLRLLDRLVALTICPKLAAKSFEHRRPGLKTLNDAHDLPRAVESSQPA